MSTLLEQFQSNEPMISVELRPPRADLASVDCIDTWMAMHGTVRRLSRRQIPLFITDGAVGTEEEENLHHLVVEVHQSHVTVHRQSNDLILWQISSTRLETSERHHLISTRDLHSWSALHPCRFCLEYQP